ncbi:Protein of unknown function [Acetitomaculum ruminis DSM 5522]|uniref:DUF3793 family protein n=1 Tax=Acetitomaculum ruminis DSM 5522 TaxID=1120918 RepID=A0A1I0Y0P4_9FIRM|nr:DUF3793 family protein [Acetitomaculum ruminis]SFB06734.1 Protein of unknown function [Acetitomaculum ruminis DSM 5522]
MPEGLVIKHCSPTLAGIKTANLFSCVYKNKNEVKRTISFLNKQLKSKGIRVIPMRFSKTRVLIYMYRPDRLKSDLSLEGTQKLLKANGYEEVDYAHALKLLHKKLQSFEDFPHEIGLFLGYPPEDVRGFITNHALNYKFIGYWKVYGDEEKARKTFSQYKNCTNSYLNQWKKGKSITDLAVAV